MIQKLQKLLSILTIVVLLSSNSGVAYALDMPQAPTAPTAPSAPEAPPAPEAPEAPPAPENTTASPISPQAPSLEEAMNETDANYISDATDEEEEEEENNNNREQNGTDGISDGGNVGDTDLTTGDATNNGSILTLGNDNLSGNGGSGNGSVSVVNNGNGGDSTNNGSVALVDANTLLQDNNANVTNTLSQNANSGNNESSGNVGNTLIDTGDANVSGTIITAVNTNVDGIGVAEFTVANDYQGDIILDFAKGCLAGCGGSGDTTVANLGNGSDSTNTASANQVTDNTTFQNNDATVANNMTLAADSGNNAADSNTGGDSIIGTGDANVSANVLTFANNNIVGNVLFGVVNIFGNLIGDIILPDSVFSSCTTCGGNTTVANTGNGDNSTNDASSNQNTNNLTFQTNDATIENNLILGTTTGNNSASGSTGGNSTITTGDSSITAQTVNVANSNIDGGTWWLVIVNKAGQWVGQIMGAPQGATLAGSSGTEFTVNENGEITATNAGNGSGSTNTADLSQTTNNTTVQTNTAHIVNNVDLSANTGGNSTSGNTGGNNRIATGDAKVIANLVNFVNNNISGKGRLAVAVVNVFGSWIGDFVTPGHEKKKESLASASTDQSNADDRGIGGQADTHTENKNNTAGGNNTSGSGNASNTQASNTSNDTTSNTQGTSQNNTGRGGISLVAGASSVGNKNIENVSLGSFSEKTAGKKAVKVNLAFLLLLLPLFLVIIIGKRVVLHKMRR